MFKGNEYSKLSKILHHLVLSNQIIPEFLLDLEYFFFKKKIIKSQNKKHVFVCGLPRSGTTILMKSLYENDRVSSSNAMRSAYFLVALSRSKVIDI